ncbi:MAG: Smr/MutS family protein, partial [Bacteroidales bacterium]|nr:Smr/MutS family protein [Bacteroidales bacterium]
KNRRQLDEKLLKIKHTDKTLENITDRYQKELEEIQSSKKEIIAQAKKEAQEILQQANRQIEATIKSIKEAQAERERTKLARKELEEFNKNLIEGRDSESDQKIAAKMQQLIERKKRKEERKREAEKRKGHSAESGNADISGNAQDMNMANRPLAVGDKVKLKGRDLIGEIIQIGGKDITISVGNIISKMDKSAVERISNKEFGKALTQQPKQISNHSASLSERKLNFKPSIDVRGERLVDALDIVGRFIDDALMVGMDQVKILHGKGNGILKEELRKYIKTIPGVESCKDEDIRFGGSGITIVTFTD